PRAGPSQVRLELPYLAWHSVASALDRHGTRLRSPVSTTIPGLTRRGNNPERRLLVHVLLGVDALPDLVQQAVECAESEPVQTAGRVSRRSAPVLPLRTPASREP